MLFMSEIKSVGITERVLYEGSSSQKNTKNKCQLLNVMHFVWLTVVPPAVRSLALSHRMWFVFHVSFLAKLHPSERKTMKKKAK